MMRNQGRLGRRQVAAVAVAWIAIAVAGRAAAASAADEPATPEPMAATGQSRPFQLSLTEDIQVFDGQTSVVGVRLGMSSRNVNVSGYDQGGLSARTSGDEVGLQVAAYCDVEGDLSGLQLAAISADVDGTSRGGQLSLINRSGKVIGAQIGAAFNRALSVVGLQVALVNYAEDLDGVQLGVINIHRNSWVPVFPGINVGF